MTGSGSPRWQRERAKTRQPYQPKLVVLEGTPCHFCDHPRSSHSSLILQAHCRTDGCECPVFDPICGCGHILTEHTWGTQPYPWECAFCPCKRFGANMTGTVERKEREVVMAVPADVARPKLPEPEIHEAESPYGQKCRWGRRSISLYDCASLNCHDLATYWTSRAHVSSNGKMTTTKGAYCGRHFRQWATKWLPSTQLTLF
jgi:hypothetical protein